MLKGDNDTKEFCIEMLPVIFLAIALIVMHVLKQIYLR